MRKTAVLFGILAVMISGCGSSGDQYDEVYYAERIFFSDLYGNMTGLYTAENEAFTESRLELDDDSFRFTYDNGTETKTFTGKMSCEVGDDATICDGKTDETGADIIISYTLDENRKKDMVEYCTVTDNMGCMFFGTEKHEAGEGTAANLSVDEQGMFVDNTPIEKEAFTETELYETLVETFKNTFTDNVQNYGLSDHNLMFIIRMPEGTAYYLKNEREAIEETWTKICDTMDQQSSTYATAVHGAGYKEIDVSFFMVSDEDKDDVLYISTNGDMVYNIIDDLSGYATMVSPSAEAPEKASTTAVSEPFMNQYGTSTTRCHESGCNNYIARSGDTWDCEKHANKCLNCGKYIDCDAMYCMECLTNATASSSKSSGSFTNKYGTSTTRCHESGCDNYIARSGDTWDCEKHANKCLNCGKYIDCDAMYCMDCLAG